MVVGQREKIVRTGGGVLLLEKVERKGPLFVWKTKLLLVVIISAQSGTTTVKPSRKVKKYKRKRWLLKRKEIQIDE